MMKKAIPITYKIFATEEISHDYVEYFVPYSGKELQKSPFLSGIGKEYAVLFAENKKNDFDFLPYENVPDKKILPDTANILMDAIYCINAIDSTLPSHSSFKEHFLWIDKKEKVLGSNINGISDVVKFWFLNNSFSLVYVGLYTELMKIEIAEIKYVISVLICLYNSADNIDKELADSFLKKIKKMYSLNIDNFTITNRDSVKEGIFCFFKQIDCQSKQKNCCIKINLQNFDRFINLLKKYRKHWGKANFIEGWNCFCLAKEGNKFFFSFSGNDNDHKYEELGGKVKNDLEAYFKPSSFTFCELNDNVLSYGYLDENKKFQEYQHPLKLADVKSNPIDCIKMKLDNWQYCCCERKIFPYTTNKNQPLYVFCKYEPCCRCIPAVKEQKALHSEFLFLALVKDSHELRRILKKERDLFLKNGVLNIYSFF